MKKVIKLIFIIPFTLGCNQNSQSNEDKSLDTSTNNSIVKLHSSNDTDYITSKLSNHRIFLHYYKNRPQFVVIDFDQLGLGYRFNHFAKENKGVYFTISDSNTVGSFGLKYPDGHSGFDIIPAKNTLRMVKTWSEYENDGYSYDFSGISSQKIKVFKYSNGEIIDSFTLIKK